MRNNRLLRRIIAIGMTAVFLMSMCGCAKKYEKAVALAEPASSGSGSGVEKLEADETFSEAYRSYALTMFRMAHEGVNNSFTVSPISVMLALAMVENGASGETLSQMEEMFGLPKDTMNRYLSTLIDKWSKDAGVKVANSIWIQDEIADSAKRSFLDVCSKCYRASVFKAPLDGSTVKDINTWVSKNTDDMIPELLKEMTPGLRMLLVNTVLFDRNWAKPFDKAKTEKNADFYGENGEKTGTVDLMCEKSTGSYYRDDLCTSVHKYYEEYNNSFVVFQPREGVSLETLIEALTPEYLDKVYNYDNRKSAQVTLEMPRFTTDYRNDAMETILRKMGMTAAFSGGLTEILDNRELAIDFVIHQVRVEVDEEGTRAAAATAVGLKEAAAAPIPEEITVRLDRPFVYMIMDDEIGIPLFIGTYEG